MAFMTFHIVGNVIIPTEFHFFQRGRYTTNQIRYVYKWVIYHYVQRSKATLVGHDPLLKWVIYQYVQRSKATLVGHDPLLKWPGSFGRLSQVGWVSWVVFKSTLEFNMADTGSDEFRYVKKSTLEALNSSNLPVVRSKSSVS